MKIISTLARVCLLTLSLAVTAVHAYALLDVTDHLVSTDAIQMGRLSRNAVPQDWANSESYPGQINGGVAYHYRTYSVSVGPSQYVQIVTDASGGAAGVVFTSAYLTSYNPASPAATWVGDAGSSGNFFSGTNPNYFNVLVPANSTLVVVINETSPAALNQNYRLIVEGYISPDYSSLVGTTTTLASSLNASTNGASVTFQSSVNGSNPTGSVDFRDAGVSIPGCGAQPLLGGGNSPVASCTTSSLALGTHPIQAFYSGDVVNAPSSSVIVNQVVNPLGGTLACSPNPQQEISNVQCVLTLAGNNPTGTVTFLDGAANIAGCVGVPLAGVGNTKTATCNTTGLSVGAHTITTMYSGSGNNPGGPSSNSVNQVITPRPATTTTVGSSMNPSTTGALVTYTATITGAGPTGTVQFKDGATILTTCSARPVVAAAASCTIGLATGVHTITGTYSGDVNNAPSSGNVMQTVTCVGRGCPPP